MAEIDKSLPNVKQTLKVPSQQQQMEIAAEAQESGPSQPEVTKNEDGSAEITFEPGAVNQEGKSSRPSSRFCFRSCRSRTLEQLR